MSFNLIRSNGPIVSDPRLLPRYSINLTALYRSTATGVQNSESGAFFHGAPYSINREAGSFYLNASWTTWAANTYRTLLTVTSGGGYVANLFSCGVSTSQLFTYRITVDGVVYEVPIAVNAAGERGVLGYLMPVDAFHATTNYGHDFRGTSADGLTSLISAGVALGANDPRIPIALRFENSLLVEGKVQTAAGSSTAGDEFSGGILRRTL